MPARQTNGDGRERFGPEYYRRFYGDPDSRVSDRAKVRSLATFVAGYLRYLEVPVRTILDVGCGVGHWRTAARALGRERFDLVVCQGVLQYLDDRAAAKALSNLARWTDGALYLEALTARDWRHNCDRTRTDGDVHLRPGDWYRRRLGKHFLAGGGGVFVSRRSGVTLYELEGS